jgi:hypothetical protein
LKEIMGPNSKDIIEHGLNLMVKVVKTMEEKYQLEYNPLSRPYGRGNKALGVWRHTAYFTLIPKNGGAEKQYSICEPTGFLFCVKLREILLPLMIEMNEYIASISPQRL